MSIRPEAIHSVKTHLHGSFVSHCSQNVLSLWLKQRWPGRSVKLAQPASSTLHTLHSWGSLTGSNISTGAVPSLAPHTRTGRESRALLGVVVLFQRAFLSKPASPELQLPASKHLTGYLLQSDLATEPPFSSLGIAPGCYCSQPPSPLPSEVQPKVTPARISGEFFSTHMLPWLDCDFLVRKRTALC